MRLYNFYLTDWSEGVHTNTEEDTDGHLSLQDGETSGYWEIELDLLSGCRSTIKTTAALHPNLLYYYPDSPSSAGDTTFEAADALRLGDMIIVDCPADPTAEDDDVDVCRKLVAQEVQLFLRVTPDYFGDIGTEAPGFFTEVMEQIAPTGIFMDGWGSEDGVSAGNRQTVAALILERLMFRIYSGDTPSDFSFATANDYWMFKEFFSDGDADTAISSITAVTDELSCSLIGYTPDGPEVITSWTIATICGLSYWGIDDSSVTSSFDLPRVYCGYQWLENPTTSAGVPSRVSDTGILSWDYRKYPIFTDSSIQVDITRLNANYNLNYPTASVAMKVGAKDGSGGYCDGGVLAETAELPHFCGIEAENTYRYVKVTVLFTTDDGNISPKVSYVDMQVRYLSGLVSSFFPATQRMVKNFPRWMNMRELESSPELLPESLGGKFLNFAIGEALNDGWTKYYWDQAQKDPNRLDLGQMAWCWKVPRTFADLYEITAELDDEDNIALTVCCSTEEFLGSYSWEDTVLFTSNGLIYCNRAYDRIKVNEEYYHLEDQHIWNSLDSWGMVLDLPRLRLETNQHYYDRIYDVAVNMPTANLEGIQKGLQRELSICQPPSAWLSTPALWGITPPQWSTPSAPSTPIGNWATPAFGCTPQVIELFKLRAGDLEWFDEQGFPTNELIGWVNAINERVGVTWDTMKQRKALWDSMGPEGEALGTLPFRYDITPWPATPAASTPWWAEAATPQAATPPFYVPGMWQYGVGDFNDLLVQKPLPPTANQEFQINIHIDGLSESTQAYYPAVEVAWEARGIAGISLYPTEVQDWAMTIFATEDATPDATPSNWEYYTTLSGNTIYKGQRLYFSEDDEPGSTPDNLNVQEYELFTYSGAEGPRSSSEWIWRDNDSGDLITRFAVNDVIRYAIYNGEWEAGSTPAWVANSDNDKVDVYWSAIDEVSTGTSDPVELNPPIMAYPCVKANYDALDAFENDHVWQTDWHATPPGSSPYEWGPYRRYGHVITNGIASTPTTATPWGGKNDVVVWAPLFMFHSNAYNHEWEIEISSRNESDTAIGYTVDTDGNPTTTTAVAVTVDNPENSVILEDMDDDDWSGGDLDTSIYAEATGSQKISSPDMRACIISDVDGSGGIESAWTHEYGTSGAHDTDAGDYYQGIASWRAVASNWSGNYQYSRAYCDFSGIKDWSHLPDDANFNMVFSKAAHPQGEAVESTVEVRLRDEDNPSTKYFHKTFTIETGPNLQSNSDFEECSGGTDFPGWTESKSTRAYISQNTDPWRGTYNLSMGQTNGLFDEWARVRTSGYITVDNTEYYQFSYAFKTTNFAWKSAYPPYHCNLQFSIRCYNSSSSYLGSIEVVGWGIDQAAYTRKSYEVTPTELQYWGNTAKVKIDIYATFQDGTDWWDLSGCQVDSISFVPISKPTWQTHSCEKQDFTNQGGATWDNIGSIRCATQHELTGNKDSFNTVNRWDICYWSPYETTSDSATYTYGGAQDFSGNDYFEFRGHHRAPAWDTGAAHAGITLGNTTIKQHIRETSSKYFYPPDELLIADAGWGKTTETKIDLLKAGSPDPVWTNINSLYVELDAFRVTVSDASALDGQTATDAIAVLYIDEWSFQPGGANAFDSDTSKATFSSSYQIPLNTEDLWISNTPVQMDNQLTVPEVWSTKLEFIPGDFGLPEEVSPYKFRIECDNEDLLCWLSDNDAQSLDDATEEDPLIRYLYVKAKDYSAIEWNPRIHSGSFYTPFQEHYLYSEAQSEIFNTLETGDCITLSSLPRQGAPVVILDDNDTYWRKITSWSYENDIPMLSHVIEEEVIGTGSTRLYTAYRLIKDVEVTNLTTEETWEETTDFTVTDNIITFDDYITNRDHTYNIIYTPRQAFYIDMFNTADSTPIQRAKIYLSESLEDAEASQITVYYEGAITNPYYTEPTIRLNPLLTYWQQAFIFLQMTDQYLDVVELGIDPWQITGDGHSWSNIWVTVLDENGNPTPNAGVMLEASGGEFPNETTATTVTTNEEGFASTMWTAPEVGSDTACTISATYYRRGELQGPDDYIITVLAPEEQLYHLDVKSKMGRALTADGASEQILEITLLDENFMSVKNATINRSMWNSDNYTPSTGDLSDTTDEHGKLIDRITVSDTPRQVFCEYKYSKSGTDYMDTISWREYEVFNHPLTS